MKKKQPTFDFTNKRILITGGTRGIGYATAKAFLAAGARVALNGRSELSVNNALAELNAGDNAIGVVGDVSTVDNCNEIVRQAIEQLGGLDVLVNSAGVFYIKSVTDTDESTWDTMFDINVKGTFYCCRAAQAELTASAGSIINLSSQAGLEGYTNIAAYCASKAAVINMTRAMALEFAPNVRVNSICPGFIDTDMTHSALSNEGEDKADLSEAADSYPLKRLGTAEEVATSILYLASEHAAFITGSALSIDGGGTAGR